MNLTRSRNRGMSEILPGSPFSPLTPLGMNSPDRCSFDGSKSGMKRIIGLEAAGRHWYSWNTPPPPFFFLVFCLSFSSRGNSVSSHAPCTLVMIRKWVFTPPPRLFGFRHPDEKGKCPGARWRVAPCVSDERSQYVNIQVTRYLVTILSDARDTRHDAGTLSGGSWAIVGVPGRALRAGTLQVWPVVAFYQHCWYG